MVGEQRVGQLPEVQLAEGAHRVDILPEDFSGQVWDLFGVKLVPTQQIGEEEIEQRGSQPTTHLLIRKHTNEDISTLQAASDELISLVI